MPGDDIILLIRIQVYEIRRKSGYPYYQISVFIRVLLSFSERFAVDHVVLDFHAAVLKIILRDISQLSGSFVIAHNGRMHPDIKRHSVNILVVVIAACGFEYPGPFLSRPCAGEAASAIGSPNFLPSGVAQVLYP